MFGLSKALGISTGVLVIACLVMWIGWGRDKDALEELRAQAGIVLLAIQDASDNPDLKWGNAAGQVVALGEAHRSVKVVLQEQNQTIDEMAREAVRLKRRSVELQRIANKAQAQRRAALEQLSDMTLTPGTREDCLTLLSEAERALDLVKGAGL